MSSSVVERLIKSFPALLVVSEISEDPLVTLLEEPLEKKESLLTPMQYGNAGKFEMMNEAGDIFEIDNQSWTGVQLNVQNNLSQQFATFHTFSMGKKENIDPFTNTKDDEKSQYAFTSFLQTKNWVLQGRWTAGCGTSTRAVVAYNRKPVSFQLSGNFADDDRKSGFEAEVALTGLDMCAQVKIQGPAVALSYTQPISSSVSIGTEFIYSVLNQASRLKWLFKNSNKKGDYATASLSTGLGPNEASFVYSHRLLKNLDIITGLDISQTEKQWTTSYKLGYNLKHEQDGLCTVKGYVDSAWKVVCLTEQLVDNTVVQFSGRVDVLKNVYDFGIGFTLHC